VRGLRGDDQMRAAWPVVEIEHFPPQEFLSLGRDDSEI